MNKMLSETHLIQTFEGVKSALMVLGLDISVPESIENFSLVKNMSKIMELVTMEEEEVLSHFSGLVGLAPMIEERAELFGIEKTE